MAGAAAAKRGKKQLGGRAACRSFKGSLFFRRNILLAANIDCAQQNPAAVVPF